MRTHQRPPWFKHAPTTAAARALRGPGLKWACAIACALLLRPAAAGGPSAPAALDLGKPPLPTGAAQQQTSLDAVDAIPLYLDVAINGQPTQTVAAFYQKDGRFYADLDDLSQLGLETARLQNLPGLKSIRVDQAQGGAKLIALDQVPGLQYRYDASRQAIALTADAQLVRPNQIGQRPSSGLPIGSDTGLVLNYDAFLQGSPDRDVSTSLSVSNEERLFSRLGILGNTGVARVGGSAGAYTRLDSAWHYDDPVRLTTAQVGDAISSSLSWSRAVRLGGLQFRRNFALRPDLITFPVPTLSGSAIVPSSVDIYINNVRQFSSDVPSGPFVINNPVALTGAGQARLVVRDELGREVSTTLPIYVDNRMVAKGLDSYSLEGGFLRRNYGVRSFDYGQAPSFSGSWRRGLSDFFTVESHGEGAAGLYNAGAGGLLRLGQWGVVNAAATGSTGRTNGTQASLGYQLILPRFSLVTQTTRNFSQYRDLASIGGTPPPRIFDQVNISVPIMLTQSIGLSYIHSRGVADLGQVQDQTGVPAATGDSVTRIGSITYTAQLLRWCSLFANAYKDFDSTHSHGFWVGVSLDLGHRVTGFVNAGRSQDQNTYGASLVKTADYGGGVEWGAQDNEGGHQYSRLARAGYLGRYGEISGAAQDNQGQTLLSLDANGGLIFMDGVLEPSRHIYDSFALISTDGISGIPVLNENRVMGNTDGSGHLLIPDLNSYQHNRIEIDSLVLPPDANIPVSRIDVVPRSQSGVLAHFAVQRYTAATVNLVDAAGKPLPSGTLLRHAESGQDFVVGYDGQAFIENLQPHNHLTAQNADPHQRVDCTAEFDYQAPGNGSSLPTIGPVTCKSSGGNKP
jgi:outer membrane usher protein